jgi:hypothetical protein
LVRRGVANGIECATHQLGHQAKVLAVLNVDARFVKIA